MAKIKIEDLPRDQKIDKEEMNKILGGYLRARISKPFLRSTSLYGPFINPVAQEQEDEHVME